MGPAGFFEQYLGADVHRQMLGIESAFSRGILHCGVEHIDQFAHIAWPVIEGQGIVEFVGDLLFFAAEIAADLSHMVACDGQNVLFSFAQGWQLDHAGAQTVVQVFAKLALLDHGFEVAVGSRDQPEIASDLLFGAKRSEAALLQDPQERFLHFNVQVADFVKKNRPSISLPEKAVPRFCGPGDRTSLMAKKQAFGQGLRDIGAVHDDEAFFRPLAVFVDGVGEKLLACACFTQDENVGVALCSGGDVVQAVSQTEACPEDGVALDVTMSLDFHSGAAVVQAVVDGLAKFFVRKRGADDVPRSSANGLLQYVRIAAVGDDHHMRPAF